MYGFLTVNERDDEVTLYYPQDPFNEISIDINISVFLRNDKNEATKDGLKGVYFDDKEIPLVYSEQNKEWRGIYPVSSKEQDHKVKMILTNGCEKVIPVHVVGTSDVLSKNVSGIFPKANTGIVGYELAHNASNIKTKKGCSALFYGQDCEKTLDYGSLNALYSEIGNAVNSSNREYDCSRLDNLSLAIRATIRQEIDKFTLISQSNESSVANEKDWYLPRDANLENRYHLLELYHAILQNTVDKERLNVGLLSINNFELADDSYVYFMCDLYQVMSLPKAYIPSNVGFIVVEIDGKLNLYDGETKDFENYSLQNLGTVPPFTENIKKTSRSVKLSKGSHVVKFYLIQYNRNPNSKDNENMTDIKWRQNLPRFRVSKEDPLLNFYVLRGFR